MSYWNAEREQQFKEQTAALKKVADERNVALIKVRLALGACRRFVVDDEGLEDLIACAGPLIQALQPWAPLPWEMNDAPQPVRRFVVYLPTSSNLLRNDEGAHRVFYSLTEAKSAAHIWYDLTSLKSKRALADPVICEVLDAATAPPRPAVGRVLLNSSGEITMFFVRGESYPPDTKCPYVVPVDGDA